VRRLSRDAHLSLAVVLVAPVLAVQVLASIDDWRVIAGVTVAFLAAQLAARSLRRRFRPRDVEFGRLALALAYVVLVSRLGPTGGTPPLLSLTLPIIALAAVLGNREALAVGSLAVLGQLAPVVLDAGSTPLARERAIAFATSAILLSVGTRRTIASLERVVERLRSTMAADRRRGRQIAGVEEVGRLLAHGGPTDAALDGVMDLLLRRFGYQHVSIYLGDEGRVRLGAQRGYESPIDAFEPTLGVAGRVMKTRQPTLVPDVTADPDYAPGTADVSSLVCVPLVSGDDLLGLINVETAPPERLDEDDLAAVRLVADRLASALALARERNRLARRVARFEQLTAFAQLLNTTLETAELYDLVTRALPSVVPCAFVSVTVRDELTGAYEIVAMNGGDDELIGKRIEPGEGISGRAIAEGRLVIDDAMHRNDFPRALAKARVPDVLAIAAVPMIREGTVVGAIAVVRTSGEGFNQLEREILPLVGSQAALAIANSKLHEAAMEASIRDPLTGLFNRRHLDVSLERLAATRARTDPGDRRPVSVILFDLDNFGQFNKQYGHAVGDDVLRTFGRILKDRFRRSDLLARFGGEEFVVVLDGATRLEAVALAEEVRTRLLNTPLVGPNGETLAATVSAGCSSVDVATPGIGGLLQTADVGLAMAKHAGRDRVVAA
jgi:diguanylate cyclase (GGDEF)-like protein